MNFKGDLNLAQLDSDKSSTGFKTTKTQRIGPGQTFVRKGSVGRPAASSTLKQSALKSGLNDLDNLSLTANTITVEKLKKFKLKTTSAGDSTPADTKQDPAAAVRYMLANRQNTLNVQKVSMQGSDTKPIVLSQSQITNASAAAGGDSD